MQDKLFDSNVAMPSSALKAQNRDVKTAIQVLRETAESESNKFEKEMLEASADKLEAEVL